MNIYTSSYTECKYISVDNPDIAFASMSLDLPNELSQACTLTASFFIPLHSFANRWRKLLASSTLSQCTSEAFEKEFFDTNLKEQSISRVLQYFKTSANGKDICLLHNDDAFDNYCASIVSKWLNDNGQACGRYKFTSCAVKTLLDKTCMQQHLIDALQDKTRILESKMHILDSKIDSIEDAFGALSQTMTKLDKCCLAYKSSIEHLLSSFSQCISSFEELVNGKMQDMSSCMMFKFDRDMQTLYDIAVSKDVEFKDYVDKAVRRQVDCIDERLQELSCAYRMHVLSLEQLASKRMQDMSACMLDNYYELTRSMNAFKIANDDEHVSLRSSIDSIATMK